MATMTMPMPFGAFESVEQNVQFVSAGLSLAQKMHLVRRMCFSLVTLTLAFRQTVHEQADLIGTLNDFLKRNDISADTLNRLAEKVERVVETNKQMLTSAETVGFPLWNDSLESIAGQCERFDDIAETFRMLASHESRARISSLVASAEEESVGAPKTDWRDFVASLHD